MHYHLGLVIPIAWTTSPSVQRPWVAIPMFANPPLPAMMMMTGKKRMMRIMTMAMETMNLSLKRTNSPN